MNNNQNQKRSYTKDIIAILVFVVVAVLIVVFFFNGTSTQELNYNQFRDNLEQGKIEKMEITPAGSGGNATLVKISGTLKDNGETIKYVVVISEEISLELVDYIKTQNKIQSSFLNL